MDSVSDMPLPETALAFLRKPNPAVMATVTSDGRPVSVATWYLIEDDGRLMLCMNDDRARLKHLQNNGHVSLTVLAAEDFGTHISVQGHVCPSSPTRDSLTSIGSPDISSARIIPPETAHW